MFYYHQRNLWTNVWRLYLLLQPTIEFKALIELPSSLLLSKGSKKTTHNRCGNIAVATTSRVLILSPPRDNGGGDFSLNQN